MVQIHEVCAEVVSSQNVSSLNGVSWAQAISERSDNDVERTLKALELGVVV